MAASSNDKTVEPRDLTKTVEKTASIFLVKNRCHDLLYAESVPGEEAQKDILKIITLKVAEYLINKNENLKKELFAKAKERGMEVKEENFKKFTLDYISRTNPKNWSMALSLVYSRLFPSMFSNSDKDFYCKNLKTLATIMEEINKLEFTDEELDGYSTNFGDIYEEFIKYSSGKQQSKRFGQFFTPRKLIQHIFNIANVETIIKEFKNPSIYDPCMGTGGLLTRLYKLGDGSIKPENIYGCELSETTIKFGHLSLALTTQTFKHNINKCNSLTENEFIGAKKFDIIFTNPPFGLKTKYNEYKAGYETNLPKEGEGKKQIVKYPEGMVKFTEMCPIVINDSTAIFLQHCIYMLNNNGYCIIVMNDGKLFTDTNSNGGKQRISSKMRQWIWENTLIKEIISAPKDTFQHTGTKTKILILQKTNDKVKIQNNTVTFSKIDRYCEKYKVSVKINQMDMKDMDFIMEGEYYIQQKVGGDEIKYVEFGEVFKLVKGKLASSAIKEMKKGPYPVINLSSYQEYDSIETYTDDGENMFISNTSSGNGNVIIQYYNGKCSHSNLMYKLEVKEKFKQLVNIKFYYCYLTYKLDYICEKFQKGSNQQSLNKDLINKWLIPVPDLQLQETYEIYTKMSLDISAMKKTISDRNKEKHTLLKNFGAMVRIKKYENMVKFGELFKFSIGQLSSSQIKEMKKGQYPVINTSSYQEYDYIETYTNDSENVFITQLSGSHGAKVRVNYYNGKCSHTNLMYKLEINDKFKDIVNVKAYYIFLLINVDYISEKFQKGSNQYRLNKNLINNWEIPLFNKDELENIMKITKCVEGFDNYYETLKNNITIHEYIFHEGMKMCFA